MSDKLLAWYPSATLFATWVQARHGSDDCRRTVLNSYPKTVQAKMRSRWHPLHTSMHMWNKNSLANVSLSCLGDRTEMAHSVEARTPFVDHHLTEYINRWPPSARSAPIDLLVLGDSSNLLRYGSPTTTLLFKVTGTALCSGGAGY
ncbi:glutamine-hydrolyzing asparagine synthase [Penicillium chermesinum]|uniref:Glutamine-hydrolyzing asparagine synthase n=1 Tax=Penicillium chermesinum TaxID=63820 RepID=A0A9W9N9V7_9EURO|nr:glutamine-hydrolyzing asparagine synthase [Penicillium chermesinum]KAJ5215064.1 glutamine-hydrolyzing asparagine synthase [Penicillium chermesinum]KAJ6141445.1 glutamine-hydrolyzing asparagine synthase [Penicillium chermesinum]